MKKLVFLFLINAIFFSINSCNAQTYKESKEATQQEFVQSPNIIWPVLIQKGRLRLISR